MEAIIIYFTGTGNTRFLANKIKAKLDDNSYHTITYSIDSESKPISLDKYDLIIFSYPIYAFNMPIIFDKYVKKLKFPANKKYLSIYFNLLYKLYFVSFFWLLLILSFNSEINFSISL